MKDFYMMIERDEEGWYIGSVPELPGCHTQARTIEELSERMKEAIELYIDDTDVSMFPAHEFVGVHRVAVS